jgi:uncharacterized protein (DUF1778 family)
MENTRRKPINLRIDPGDLALIDRGAAAERKTRTEFVVSASVDRAEDVLLDQMLSPVSVLPSEAFDDALRLLSQPSDPSPSARAQAAKARRTLKRHAE